jgi:tape measure domain-containing protein
MTTIAKRNVIVQFTADDKQFKKAAKSVEKDVKGLSGVFQQAAGTFAGLFAFQGIQALGQQITGLSQRAVGLAISAEQTQVAFETFLGSAEKARDVIAQLNEFSELTPFEPDEVIRAGQSLLAFGLEADKLEGTLKALGDISAGTGTNFNELAELFGKARVQGRLFGEDINQLTGRGIPVIAEFAKQFGVAESEVKGLVTAGKIGFPELEKAFQNLTSEGGKFFDLTAKQSQTLGGRISTLTGNFNALLRTIGERLIPAVSTVVDFFGNLTRTAKEFIETPVSERLEEQRIALNGLVLQITDANTSEAERVRLINELNKQYPELIGNVDAETVSNEELNDILKDVNEQLINRIILQQKEEEVQEAATIAASQQIDVRERIIKLNRDIADVADRLNISLEGTATAEERINKIRSEQGFAAVSGLLQQLAQLNNETIREEQLTEASNKLLQEKNDLSKELGLNTEVLTDKTNKNTKSVTVNNKELEKRLKLLEKLNSQIRKDTEETEDNLRASLQAEQDARNEFFDKQIQDTIEQQNALANIPPPDFIAAPDEQLDDEVSARIEAERLKQEAIMETARVQRETAAKILDSTQQLADATIGAAKDVLQAQLDALDGRIEAQEKAVDDALKLNRDASNEQLQIEEDRLEKLQAERARAADQFRVIAQIEAVATQALAVSKGILAVTEAFATGTVVEGIATSVALAATIAGAIVSLNSAFNDIPAFAEGTERVKGPGTATSDSINARLSAGERVVPTSINDKYFSTLNEFQYDTPKAKLLHDIATGNVNIPMLANSKGLTSSQGESNKGMMNELKGIKKSLDKLDINVTMDKNGFAASIAKHLSMKDRFRKKVGV